MDTKLNGKKISIHQSIEKLGLPERQRNRALADLAAANTIVGVLFAASKLLHLR